MGTERLVCDCDCGLIVMRLGFNLEGLLLRGMGLSGVRRDLTCKKKLTLQKKQKEIIVSWQLNE